MIPWNFSSFRAFSSSQLRRRVATFDIIVTPGPNLIRVYGLIHSCVLSSLLNSRGARPDIQLTWQEVQTQKGSTACSFFPSTGKTLGKHGGEKMLCLKLDQPAEVHQGLKKRSGAECAVCKNNQNNQANNLLPTPPLFKYSYNLMYVMCYSIFSVCKEQSADRHVHADKYCSIFHIF